MKNSPVEDDGVHHQAASTLVASADPSLSTDAIVDEELSIKISDKTVFDCPICFHPLTIPVFQCVNGHVTCFSCLDYLKQKCPSCYKNLGSIRNQALESVLESIKVSCSYKSYRCCVEEFSYSAKHSHEETCSYAPYFCPFKDCNFMGSPRNLYLHLKILHLSFVIPLQSNGPSTLFREFSAKKEASDEFVVLLEEGDHGAIFIFNHRLMRIRCIQDPNLSEVRRFDYLLTTLHDCGSFTFRHVMYLWPNVSDSEEKANGTESVSERILKILEFFDHDGCIRLWLSIAS